RALAEQLAQRDDAFLRTGKYAADFGRERCRAACVSGSRAVVEGDVRMKRLMRLRASQHLRDLCAETEFNRAQLIQPFFVVEGLKEAEPIPGLRGNLRHNIPSALRQIEKDLKDGVTHFLLFPVPSTKKESG